MESLLEHVQCHSCIIILTTTCVLNLTYQQHVYMQAQPMMNQTTPETGEVEEVEHATIDSSREQLLPGHDQVLWWCAVTIRS